MTFAEVLSKHDEVKKLLGQGIDQKAEQKEAQAEMVWHIPLKLSARECYASNKRWSELQLVRVSLS